MDIFKKEIVLPTSGMSIEEIAERKRLIGSGLRSVIEQENLCFTKDQRIRLLHALYHVFWKKEKLDQNDVHYYIYDLYDFSDKGDPETVISSILVTADTPLKYKSESRWFIALLLVIIAAVVYIENMPSPPMSQQESIELKSLVANIVGSEKAKGNKISHQLIWNNVKNLDAINEYEHKNSYKDFSQEQYQIAKNYLKNFKISKNNNQKVLSNLKASDINVVDGDTFKAQGNKFRLWGVDAFEMKQLCYLADKTAYLCGEKSKKTLQSIFDKAKEIKCSATEKGKYGRYIAKCLIDGIALGQLLARSGWALDYTQYSGGMFKEFEQAAQQNKVGAWAGCFVKPWDYRHKKNLNLCNAN